MFKVPLQFCTGAANPCNNAQHIQREPPIRDVAEIQRHLRPRAFRSFPCTFCPLQGVPERLKHLSQVSVDSDDNDSLGGGSGRRGRAGRAPTAGAGPGQQSRAARVRSAEYPSPRPAAQLFAAVAGAPRASARGRKPFHLPRDDHTSIRLSNNAIAPESRQQPQQQRVGKRDSSEQSDSGRYSSDENTESLNGAGGGGRGLGGPSLQEAFLITDGRTTSLHDGYLVQHVRPKMTKSSSVDSPHPSAPSGHALQDYAQAHTRVVIPAPNADVSDDELDAIVKAQDAASPVLVTSLRDELQRLANKRPDDAVAVVTKF